MKVELPYVVKINPILVILGTLFLIIMPFLTWAYLCKIDQTAKAKGVIITTSKKQSIQSINEGIIKELYVKEGDIIKKGQVIGKIDEKQFQIEYEATKSKKAAIEATVARLEAETFGKELVFEKSTLEYKGFVESEKELYKRRIEALNNELIVLNNSLKLAKEELSLMEPLAKKGDVGTIELIKLKRQVSDIEGQITNKKNKYKQDSQTELVKSKQDLAILTQDYNDKKINLERTEIISSVNGIVNNILITTKEAKIKAGDVILEVIPEDNLLIEAKLSPSDISFVKEGQNVFIKLDSYDYAIFGGIEGKVKLVGSDALVEKTGNGDEYFFKVIISIGEGKNIKTKNGNTILVSPGMGGEIDIKTGERTVLTYLIKPIIKTLDSSFKER